MILRTPNALITIGEIANRFDDTDIFNNLTHKLPVLFRALGELHMSGFEYYSMHKDSLYWLLGPQKLFNMASLLPDEAYIGVVHNNASGRTVIHSLTEREEIAEIDLITVSGVTCSEIKEYPRLYQGEFLIHVPVAGTGDLYDHFEAILNPPSDPFFIVRLPEEYTA